MSKYWSSAVTALSPYVPGEQPKVQKLTKLNTNENPYGPSPQVIQAIQAAANEKLRRYPDPDSTKLRQVISEHYGFGLTNENIFVGNGSDEVLGHAFYAFFKQQKPVLFPDITYGFYPVYCRLYDIEYSTLPLNSNFEIDLGHYEQDNGGIIIANPNATTGLFCDLSKLEHLLKMNPNTVVLVDEAYVDFGAQSAISLVAKYPQLLVVQTLSKSRSLAGLRVGFAVGHKDLIVALRRVKDSFNSYPMDSLAEAAAVAAFEDKNYFKSTVQQVIEAREKLCSGLSIRGFSVLPSKANFLLVEHSRVSGSELFEYLRSIGILVRYFDKPRLRNHLRITIGTPAECELLIKALDDSDFELNVD